MSIPNKNIQFLLDMGLKRSEAKLYLVLLKLEETGARELSEKANFPRGEIYRTLDELEKKGLVVKEITTPYKFKATPPDLGLQLLAMERNQRFKKVQERTKEFLQELDYKNERPQKEEYKLFEIKGRQKLIQIIKLQHDSAQLNIKIISDLKRWLQILYCCFESYEKALERGIEYQVIIDANKREIRSNENIRALITNPNFELKLIRGPLKSNVAIFDQKEITVNFFPSKSLAESPMIWTNHPSFILMCQDHFEAIWKSAREYKPENKN